VLRRGIGTSATTAAAKGSQGAGDNRSNSNRYPIVTLFSGFFLRFSGALVSVLSARCLLRGFFRLLGWNGLVDFNLDRCAVNFDFYGFLRMEGRVQ